jgi:hypothetical protein
MANITYTSGKVLFTGGGDWGSSAQKFRVLLATKDYAPSVKDRRVSDVTGELTSGSGYSRKEIRGRKVVQNDDTGRADCMADAVKFTGLSTKQSYRWAVIFRAGETDASSELVCAIDLSDVSLRGMSEHTIKWSGQDNGRAFSIT